MEQTNQNEDTKFVLLFTKSTTHQLRNEVSHFLLIETRMSRPGGADLITDKFLTSVFSKVSLVHGLMQHH